MSNAKSVKSIVEFLITLNDNIVVRREFEIDNYNHLVRKSVEWYDYILDLRDWLEDFLVWKSSEYMSVNSDEIIINHDFLKNQQNNSEEFFNIMIKVDGEIIGHRKIDAKLFPPNVRYTLDVRPFISDIRSKLVKLLSVKKKLTHEYLGYDLIGGYNF